MDKEFAQGHAGSKGQNGVHLAWLCSMITVQVLKPQDGTALFATVNVWPFPEATEPDPGES